MNLMQKAIIYTRVSTDEQVTNFSLGFQEKMCKEYAKRESWKVVEVFKEEGASAKTIAGRPVLRELVKYCKNKKNGITKVLVYKFDRWTRNAAEGMGLRAILAGMGIRVISATEPSEDDATGNLVSGMMMLVAEFDNNVKSERTISGMRAAFEAGHWPWRKPTGYKKGLVNGENSTILETGYKELLSDFFLLASSGLHGKQELADWLNKNGFKKLHGSEASINTVERIVKKKFYYGVMQALSWGEENWGNHQPVTTREIWIKAYDHVFRGNKLFKRSNDEDFPLRRWIKCGCCNKPMTGSFSTGRGGKYGYYHMGKGCNNRTSTPVGGLNDTFINYLNQFSLSKEKRVLLEEVLAEKINKQIREQEKNRLTLARKVEELKGEKISIVKALDRGLMTSEEAEKAIESTREDMTMLELELSEAKIDEGELATVINFSKHLLNNLGTFWEELDLPRKRFLQSRIFPKAVHFDGDKIGTEEISPSFQLIKAIRDGNKRMVTQRVWNWNHIFTDLRSIYTHLTLQEQPPNLLAIPYGS